MSPEKEPYHFDYRQLDDFLQQDSYPKDLARNLDEIMADLVDHSFHDESYQEFLSGRYYVLRALRDIFMNLKQS